MIELDRRLGPWSLRVWGLMINLAGNALAIYGALGVIRDGTRIPHFIIGMGITIACVLLLAKPSGDASRR